MDLLWLSAIEKIRKPIQSLYLGLKVTIVLLLLARVLLA